MKARSRLATVAVAAAAVSSLAFAPGIAAAAAPPPLPPGGVWNCLGGVPGQPCPQQPVPEQPTPQLPTPNVQLPVLPPVENPIPGLVNMLCETFPADFCPAGQAQPPPETPRITQEDVNRLEQAVRDFFQSNPLTNPGFGSPGTTGAH